MRADEKVAMEEVWHSLFDPANDNKSAIEIIEDARTRFKQKRIEHEREAKQRALEVTYPLEHYVQDSAYPGPYLKEIVHVERQQLRAFAKQEGLHMADLEELLGSKVGAIPAKDGTWHLRGTMYQEPRAEAIRNRELLQQERDIAYQNAQAAKPTYTIPPAPKVRSWSI